MRWVVLGVVLGGCYIRPEPPRANGGADHDAALDMALDSASSPQRDCTGRFFTNTPAPIPTVPNTTEPYDPVLSGDELEFFYTFDPDPAANNYLYQIGHATRATTADAFMLTTTQPFNSAQTDQDPAVSADGKTLMFASNRAAVFRLHQVERDAVGEPWSTVATLVPGLEDATVISLDLSWDATEVYFDDGAARLLAARRGAGGTFTVDPLVLYPTVDYPTVSSDGLELYFNGPAGEVFRAARTTKGVMFAPATPTGVLAVDPHLSHDGQTLVAKVGTQVSVFRRTCL